MTDWLRPISFHCLLILLGACSSDITEEYERYEYYLENEKGEVFKAFLADNTDIKIHKVHIQIPNNNTAVGTVYKLVVKSESDTIFIENGYHDYSNLLCPHRFSVNHDGDACSIDVQIYNLPVIIIETPDHQPITSREVRTEGCSVSIISDGVNVDIGTAGIRGRGSSSWDQEKKPYNIKLDKKHEILGMGKSKHWILLANAYYDRTQLHNATAFEMARLTDFPWVQSGRFVELILNKEHKGLYYLCEKIGVENGKIEIASMTPTDIDGENVTGGYLLESRVKTVSEWHKHDMPPYFLSDYFNTTGSHYVPCVLEWELKEPEGQIPQEQTDYLLWSLNHMEKLIYDKDSLKEGKYREYFDIESAINWWLVEEATLNEEASRSKNIYMYKDRGGRFTVGPPWDFDAWTFGVSGTQRFRATKTTLYYNNLFEDPVFVQRVKEKWAKYRPIWLEKIPAFIDEQYTLIEKAALRNEMMWPDVCPEYNSKEKSLKQSVEEMKDAFYEQMEWMNTSINNDFFLDWWSY